ncbi:MAG: class I SAM-dependent methyltransferase [Planctomycetota bacterium]
MFGFDQQAQDYPERAGLPHAAAAAVARALLEQVAALAGDTLLDVGAGTGEIGHALIARRVRYIGLDVSLPMLRTFARTPGRYLLVQADANQDWPVKTGAARLIFCSRSAHLLHTEHLVAEARRVGARGGAHLVIGRIDRPAASLQAEMRQKMRALLQGLTTRGRNKEDVIARIVAITTAAGGKRLEPCIAARLTATHSPARALQSWRRKPGLAGIEIEPALKERVLTELTTWARQTYGDLDATRTSDEQYVLETIRLPD